jgi:uncharacterized protein (DUF1697 family)
LCAAVGRPGRFGNNGVVSTTTYVALLRGVNVAGRAVPMDALRGIFCGLGHRDVTTYIQSGNVVFRTPEEDHDVLADEIHSAIASEIGHRVTVVLRTAEQLALVVAHNPLDDGRESRGLHVTFLAQAPDPLRMDAITPVAGVSDEFRRIGQEIFVYCPDGYGRTRLTNDFFERRLGIAATTRNWRTVTTLARMAAA